MKASSVLKLFFDRVRAIVSSDRSNAYGDPVLNHMRIPDLWIVWLKNSTWGPEITPYDASMMMGLVKFARCQHKPSTSNHEDIAGYASVSDFIYEGLKKDVEEYERSQGTTPQDTKKQDVQPHIHYRDGSASQKKS